MNDYQSLKIINKFFEEEEKRLREKTYKRSKIKVYQRRKDWKKKMRKKEM
ncbi:hypothetical protein ES708_31130 [subsurface metagenome]